MMENKNRYGLMVVSKGVEEKINIGDYIQSLAAMQFYPKVHEYIERETELKQVREKLKMIMNGWFIVNPEAFPPSDNIDPLYVAFHINKLNAEALTSEECIAHYKKHEPIGCRDYFTRDLLISKGVDAYLSGCLTLTLGDKYKSSEKDGKVYFTDVPLFRTEDSLKKHPVILLKAVINTLLHPLSTSRFARKLSVKTRRQFLLASYNFHLYNKVFDTSIIDKAVFVDQYNYNILKKYKTNKELLGYAESLLHDYARASLVVTSRIHCALPSLSLGTPVIYINPSYFREIDLCRLNGIIELFNSIEWKNNELDYSGPKITLKNIPQNKTTWKVLADALTTKCKQFCK